MGLIDELMYWFNREQEREAEAMYDEYIRNLYLTSGDDMI